MGVTILLTSAKPWSHVHANVVDRSRLGDMSSVIVVLHIGSRVVVVIYATVTATSDYLHEFCIQVTNVLQNGGGFSNKSRKDMCSLICISELHWSALVNLTAHST